MTFISGGSGNDTLNGTAVNDQLRGNDGNDILFGHEGIDQVSGGNGDDRITGGTGNDFLTGGFGNDTLVYAGAMSGYSISVDADGELRITDTNVANGNEGTDTSQLSVNGIGGVERLEFADGALTFTVTNYTQIRVSQPANGWQSFLPAPDVGALPNGGYVIAWSENLTGPHAPGEVADHTHEIRMQFYDAAGVAIGNDVAVSTQTAGDSMMVIGERGEPVVTGLANGNVVVAWQASGPSGTPGDDGDAYGIYARVFTPGGAALGAEFRVNAGVLGSQFRPEITALSGGGFAVSWNSNAGGAQTLYAQYFDANGNTVGDEITVVGVATRHSFAALPNGGFVAAWQDGSGIGVQRFTANGDALGLPFTANPGVPGAEPCIAVGPDGGFIVSWTGNNDVHAARFNEAGAPIGTSFQVNTADFQLALDADVAVLADGDFVVIWSGQIPGAPVGTVEEVYGRRFSASGTPIDGTEFRVNTITNGAQFDADVTALPDGGFVVTWNSIDPVPGGLGEVTHNVHSQRYDADGNTYRITITGDAGNNFLSCTQGAAHLRGGLGNDTYRIDNSSNMVIELAGGGTDIVQASINYALGANLENLTLVGAGNLSGTGNSLNNVITGNGGNNVLNGGAGNDRMVGGGGNDTYQVNIGDMVVEAAGGGVDTIVTNLNVALPVNVENFRYTGTANWTAHGNTDNNQLMGGSANDVINGGGGNDSLNGGTGDDQLNGGIGNDAYYIDTDGDAILELVNGGVDTVNTSITHALGAHLENLRLLGAGDINGTGNALNNVITGNGGANILNGGAGIDQMTGGGGNDTYFIDTNGDGVLEAVGGGTDTVRSTITHTLLANVENLALLGAGNINAIGNALNNNLNGNAGNNVLNGGTGADQMAGGAGNDTYMIDTNGDGVLEQVAGGVDTVQASVTHALAANVEHLSLTGQAHINGFGNALNNNMSGNAGNNVLNGGLGVDMMRGGAGNDTYRIDTNGDGVLELVGGGVDTVQSTISYTMAGNVERLSLLGAAHINGTGNVLNNDMTGNAGNNVLNGGLGADMMRGGLGNDVYIVDNTGDRMMEAAAAGRDAVQASINHTLGAQMEDLALRGTATAGNGNELDNIIRGNDMANRLDGRAGRDTMDGGLGRDVLIGGEAADRFMFTTALGNGNMDQIQDFQRGADRIMVDNDIFAGLNAGAMDAARFRAGPQAQDADDRILYDNATGALYYDADGNGTMASVEFARVAAGSNLTAADLAVVD